MNLYKITQEYQDLLDQVESCNDELELDAIMEHLHSLEWDRQDKLESIAKYMQTLKAQEVGITQEIERLSNLKKNKSNAQERLKKYIAFNLESAGIQKMETDLFKFSFRKSTSLEIVDEEKVPSEYVSEKVVTSIDKSQIKKDMKDREIPGVQLREKQNLQIK